MKPALVIAALVIVFGWVLPRFIDYEEVWDALAQLDAWELAVLVGLGLGRVPTEALMYRAFLPGLALRRGDEAYLSSNFAGQLLPPSDCERGPVRLLSRWRLLVGRFRPGGVRLVPLPDDRAVHAPARRGRAAAPHRRGQRHGPTSGPALARRHCRRGLRRLPVSARRTHRALARGQDATAAVLDPGEVQARWTR